MHILTFTPDPVSQKLLARGSSESSRTGATNIDSTEVLGLSEHWIKCQPPQWDLVSYKSGAIHRSLDSGR